LPELYFEGCELTLAPGENRVISVEAGSFDRIGILTSRGNLFPVEADPVDMTTLTVTLVDNETGEPIPGSLGASASLVVHSEEIRIGPKAADEGGRVRFVLPPLKGEHDFAVVARAKGYEQTVATGRIRARESRRENVRLRYDPFDLSVSENSATLTRNEGETWPERKVTITVSPKNGYENEVRLRVEGGNIDFTLDRNVLRFSSPATATLTLLPRSTLPDGTYTLTVTAMDSTGRFSRCQSYTLALKTQRRQSSGGRPARSQIWTLVNAPIDVTWKIDDYGTYPVPDSGLSDVSVTWSLQLRDGDNSVSGRTNSVGFVRWTWEGYAWGWYQTARVTASKPGYGCYSSYYMGFSNILVPGDFSPTAQRDIYIREGHTELGARLYLTNIGHITGITMTSDASRLRFRKGDTVTAYFRVNGDYTKGINLSAEERHSGSPIYSYSFSTTRLNGVGSFSITITAVEDPPTSVGTYIIAKGEEPIAGFTGQQMIPAEAELEIGLRYRYSHLVT
jgi:hypothetical protein